MGTTGEVIPPRRNMPDLWELPPTAHQAMIVRLLNRVADAFALALQPAGTCHVGAEGNPFARG